MSMPKFPEKPDISIEDSIVQVISSIAMEELALSHILNAEGEKLQFALGTLHQKNPHMPISIDELLKVNDSVKEMLSAVTMSQMFLVGKLSTAISALNSTKDKGPKLT
jgi:hypothetical protein